MSGNENVFLDLNIFARLFSGLFDAYFALAGYRLAFVEDAMAG
jgi:hypothetical protein